MNSKASSCSTLAKDSTPSPFPLQNTPHGVVPGFRFHPTEQELVLYFLGRKILGVPLYTDVVPDIDIYKFEPFEIPGKVVGDIEWYFFSKLDKKYESGERVNRSTQSGFWKVTGPEYKIRYGTRVIAEKRFLVYYSRHSKLRTRTDWVMHEYRLTDETINPAPGRDAYAIYRLFWKGNTNQIPIESAPATAEEGEQVHGGSIAPADATLQPLEALGPNEESKELAEGAPELAPAVDAPAVHEVSPGALDLLANFGGKRSYEYLVKTREVKRPRNAKPIPSLTLSLACPGSETATEQQEPRQVAMPPPAPQQPVQPLQTTSVQTLQRICITVEKKTMRRETLEDQRKKDA